MKTLMPIVALVSVLTIACTPEKSVGAKDKPRSITAETGSVTNVSCRNAEISGKVNNPPVTTATDLSFGVLYSTTRDLKIGSAIQTEAENFDSEYNFIIDTEILEPETTYYYTSYLFHSGEAVYGEVKSFSTLAVNSMIQTADAAEVNLRDAVLNAVLDLTNCKYDALDYGFELTPEGGTPSTLQSADLSGNKFSVKAESLVPDTKYSFASFVTLDGRKYLADEKSFTTQSIRASVTAESSDVSYQKATISGKLTVDTEGTFSLSADLYYSDSATTLETLKSDGAKQTLSLKSDGTYSKELSGLAYNAKCYYCVVAMVDDVEFSSPVNNLTTKALPDGPVDLGLSVKWASVNIGASTPLDFGRFFSWADTKGQTWDGSSWSGEGFSKFLTYKLDNNGNLSPEYDAAHVLLGGSWRMPTSKEMQELIDGCTSGETTIGGVLGRLFTSKKEGYTDKSIFLPAAGYVYFKELTYPGIYGYYWTSTYSDYPPVLYFYKGWVRLENDFRRTGMPIRPVSN